jgi:hypothetical protein
MGQRADLLGPLRALPSSGPGPRTASELGGSWRPSLGRAQTDLAKRANMARGKGSRFGTRAAQGTAFHALRATRAGCERLGRRASGCARTAKCWRCTAQLPTRFMPMRRLVQLGSAHDTSVDARVRRIERSEQRERCRGAAGGVIDTLWAPIVNLDGGRNRTCEPRDRV